MRKKTRRDRNEMKSWREEKGEEERKEGRERERERERVEKEKEKESPSRERERDGNEEREAKNTVRRNYPAQDLPSLHNNGWKTAESAPETASDSTVRYGYRQWLSQG